jgi:hypothetical protein
VTARQLLLVISAQGQRGVPAPNALLPHVRQSHTALHCIAPYVDHDHHGCTARASRFRAVGGQFDRTTPENSAALRSM